MTLAAASPTVPSAEREAPVFVPGYGWVQWSRALLDAQARYLLLLHRPDAGWSNSGRFGFRRLRRRRQRLEGARCLYCGREWTCPEAVWAQAWLAPLSGVWERAAGRTSGRGGRVRGGRHRAPGHSRIGWRSRRAARRSVATAPSALQG